MASGTGRAAFAERVYAIVRRIPRASVTTYGHIAMLAGAPHHARHVGQALRDLPPDLAWSDAMAPPLSGKPYGERAQANVAAIPWHRVVNAQGRVSPRGDGKSSVVQVTLLRSEGLEVTEDGILVGGLVAVGWFPEPYDLEADEPAPAAPFDALD